MQSLSVVLALLLSYTTAVTCLPVARYSEADIMQLGLSGKDQACIFIKCLHAGADRRY